MARPTAPGSSHASPTGTHSRGRLTDIRLGNGGGAGGYRTHDRGIMSRRPAVPADAGRCRDLVFHTYPMTARCRLVPAEDGRCWMKCWMNSWMEPDAVGRVVADVPSLRAVIAKADRHYG